MPRIRRSLVVALLAFAVLATACSKGVGGNPTAPSTTVDNRPVADPSQGPAQVLVFLFAPSTGATLHRGDPWSVEQQSWCAAGLRFGIAFRNPETGAVRPDNSAIVCQGGSRFEGFSNRGVVNDRLTSSASSAKEVEVVFATAVDTASWDAGKVEVREDLPKTRWVIVE